MQEVTVFLAIVMQTILSFILPLIQLILLKLSLEDPYLKLVSMTYILMMLHNNLKLNGDKSELLVILSARRSRPTLNSVCIDNDIVSAAPSAKNIGVVFDEAMSLVPHVTDICKTSCFHLRAIRKIRQFLDKDSTILFFHAFLISRLDY